MILFCWRRLPPPGFIGGAEITEALIAAHIASLGHQVTFIGSTEPPWPTHRPYPNLEDVCRACGISYTRTSDGIEYDHRGVRCIAVPQARIDTMLARHLPKVSLLWTSQEGSPEIAAGFTGPVASYAHSVSATGLLAGAIRADWVFAPSQFVAERLDNPRTWLFRPPLDLVDTRSGNQPKQHVLFFNPIREKGVDLAVNIARELPEIPFVFVEGWWPPDDPSSWPPNVRYHPRTYHPGRLYDRAHTVLVPSTVEDASPRVLLEATVYRCPALGSRRGGIPEYLSEWQLPPSAPDAWAKKIATLTANPVIRQALVEAQVDRIHDHLSDPFSALRSSGILSSL